MDNLVYEETINTEISSSEFVDKQWLYVNDNNNSSYSGQVVIDTTALSNCGQYLNWGEAFLAFPMILQVECPLGQNLTNNTIADFMVGLKSGYWQIIHSLIVEYNNSNVVQQVPYLNIFNSFKANTSWSDGDVKNWGALTGYCLDSSDSWVYNNVAYVNTVGGGGALIPNNNIMASGGPGLTNNRNAPYVDISSFVASETPATLEVDIPALQGSANGGADTPTIPLPNVAIPQVPFVSSAQNYNLKTQATNYKSGLRSSCYNKGFWQRQEWLIYDPVLNTGNNLTNFSSNQSALMSGIVPPATGVVSNVSGYGAIFQSYVQIGTNATVAFRTIVFDAVIRMKDICDLFGKMPMVKGGTMRLYINTNQTYFTASAVSMVTDVAPYPAYAQTISHAELFLTSAPVILGGGGTNPVMLASADIGQGLYPINTQSQAVSDTQTMAVGLSIVRTQFPQLSQQVSAPITSTRLYCPAYTMSPLAEQRLLSLCPTKKVVYNDIFYYTFSNVGPGTFSFLVSNGIPNLRGCLVCPFLPKGSNGVVGNLPVTTTDTILSPFSSSPASPDPISLTNFNIQISGKNLFITNLLYDYEVFAEQLVSSNQLNGSLTTSLQSGQIGFSDFENLYRYYYGNISRSIPSEDGVAKAVQVLGTNNSTQNINFIVFLEFERTMTIDLRTGARIE